jgi:hypothetical protein
MTITHPFQQHSFSSEDDGVQILPDEMPDSDNNAASKQVAKASKEKKEKPKNIRIVDRDMDIITYLFRIQYAYNYQAGRRFGTSSESIDQRLQKLSQHGLVTKERIAGSATAFKASTKGLQIADLPHKDGKAIALGTVQHTIAVASLVAELESGSPDAVDVLDVGKWGESFPSMNRIEGGRRLSSDYQNNVLSRGEMTVTEREIRRSQHMGRTIGQDGIDYAELRLVTQLASEYEDAPELAEGNERLFIVYGGGGKSGEHIPDLVVPRPRAADGSTQSIAIEVELTPKSKADWQRILRAYWGSGWMFKRVLYYTQSSAIRDALTRIADDIGMILEDDTDEVKARKLAVVGSLSNRNFEVGFRSYSPKDNRRMYLG